MMIKIEKIDKFEAYRRGVHHWGFWSRPKSEFYWLYDMDETCYILEGKARLRFGDMDFEITPGDFISFASGAKVKWKVVEPIRKKYIFG
jgi:uncharacterized cupin superfamily protein